MCEFCESNEIRTIGSYSNHDSMDIYFDQYKGVSVYSYLEMKKDMLLLSGSGNYRSGHDCYYESEGLDCDGENSKNSKPKLIKIQYCPFCGRKLDSIEYEKECATRELPKINKLLDKLNFWKEHASVCWRFQDGKDVDGEPVLTKDTLIFDYPSVLLFDKERYSIRIDWSISNKKFDSGWTYYSVLEMPVYEKEDDLNPLDNKWNRCWPDGYYRESKVCLLKDKDFNNVCKVKAIINRRKEFLKDVIEAINYLEEEKAKFEKYI